MRFTKFIFKVVLLLLFLCNGTVFSAEEKQVIKVGISNQTFSSFEHTNVSFFANGDLLVVDMPRGQSYNPPKNAVIRVEIIDGLLKVFADDSELISKSFGPIVLTSNDLISIQNLKRKGIQASYAGQFEVKITKNFNTFNVINVLDTNTYLKGVVPNEMPVSFGLEALKAQAVAARNYANRPQTNGNTNYDICDSTACQVYFGANTHNPLADKAVEQTEGIFALYKYEPILALYSSTAGGITESYENVYGESATAFVPPKSLPYLKSVGARTLRSEDDVVDYYSSAPSSPDMKSPLYRWKAEWTREDLENVLNKTLITQSKAGLVEPRVEDGFQIEELEDIKVLKRGESGKALLLEIVAKNGRWRVRKELGIRRVLQINSSKILYSANFYIEKTERKRDSAEISSFDYAPEPKLEKITLIGGGFGHGVGMSQYGAGFMAGEGKDFVDILEYYYSGITVGTIPKALNCNKQEKFSLYFDKKMKKRVLIKIDNTKRLTNFEFYINELAFKPNMAQYDGKVLWFDITKYLTRGDNQIIVMPLCERDRGKQTSFWIEFVD